MAETVPAPETEHRRLRPWCVTYAGGLTLATFHYRDHALERAQETVRSGKLRTVWVHERGTAEMLQISRNRKQPPVSVDEGP